MADSKRNLFVLAGFVVPLLCGALWFRSSSASDEPENQAAQERVQGASRAPDLSGDYIAQAGGPSNLSQADKAALAQRAKSVSVGLASLDSATGASEIEARLARDPKDALAHRALGTYYRYKSRDLPKSISHWREAMRLEPGNNSLRFDLGMTFLRAGQRDEAMRAFEQMAAAKVEGAGLARKYAQEDVETGRQWVQKMRDRPNMGRVAVRPS